MNVRTRKFVGVWLMLGLLIAYPILAAMIYINFLPNAPVLLALTYFAIAGLAWAVPAGVIIKWMAKPDADGAEPSAE